jgi:hypothetical protein
MVSTILFLTWLFLSWAFIMYLVGANKSIAWIILVPATAFIWLFTVFLGVPIKNNSGQYTGFVTAVEQNGVIFKGYNVFLKTELESSDSDKACIDRNNKELIDELRQAQREKRNIVLEYEGVLEYGVGQCPGEDWMIKEIINIK